MAEHEIDIDALYQRYGPMVLRRCRRILQNEEDALDVMQEVFVRLLQNSERLSELYPSSLLYRIATNLSLNRLRDRRRRPDLAGDEMLHQIAIHEDVDSPLLLERLWRRQTPSTRTMAVLRYVDGMTWEEVARECGLSVSGVRKRLRKLRFSLQPKEVP